MVYDLAVRLFRKHYETEPYTEPTGKMTFASYGEFLEAALTAAFGFRPFPWAPEMVCSNGLRLLFVRPGGELVTSLTRGTWESGGTVTTDASDPKLYRDLHHDIRAGRIIYDGRGGLRQYPGELPYGQADVLAAPPAQLEAPKA